MMKHLQIPTGARLLVAAALLLVAVTPPSAPAQPNESPPAIRLQRTLQFGGDFAESSYALERPTRIAVSRGGDLYVLDDGESSVKVYDGSGRFVRQFGRKGGGPGEFQWMTGLYVNSDVRVTDMAQRRMTIFSLQGQLLRTEPVLAPDDRVLGEAVPLRHGWNVGTSTAQVKIEGGGATRQEGMQKVVYAFSSTRMDTLFQYRDGSAAFRPRDAPLPAGIASTHLGQGGAYAVLGDSIVAVADGYTGSVRWYRATPPGLVAYQTRQLPSRSLPATDADIRHIERRLRAEGGGSSLPRRLVFNAPPRSSIASEALFADDGSLWVRNTPESETGHVWTVFDRGGNISIRLQMPRGFDLKFVQGQNLYGFARHEQRRGTRAGVSHATKPLNPLPSGSGTRLAPVAPFREVNDRIREGRKAMACPTVTLTGITAEVWECCRREARRLGVNFPDDDSGTAYHPDADAGYVWSRDDGSLQVTFTRIPSYIRCEMIEARLREGARLCGAR